MYGYVIQLYQENRLPTLLCIFQTARNVVPHLKFKIHLILNYALNFPNSTANFCPKSFKLSYPTGSRPECDCRRAALSVCRDCWCKSQYWCRPQRFSVVWKMRHSTGLPYRRPAGYSSGQRSRSTSSHSLHNLEMSKIMLMQSIHQ